MKIRPEHLRTLRRELGQMERLRRAMHGADAERSHRADFVEVRPGVWKRPATPARERRDGVSDVLNGLQALERLCR